MIQAAKRAGLIYHPIEGSLGTSKDAAIGVRDGYIVALGPASAGRVRGNSRGILIRFKGPSHGKTPGCGGFSEGTYYQRLANRHR